MVKKCLISGFLKGMFLGGKGFLDLFRRPPSTSAGSKEATPVVSVAPSKKEILWASWVEKNGRWSLPLAKKYVAALKTDKQIVMRIIVCGQESMAPDQLEPKGYDHHSEKRLRAMLATYKPAPINLYRFEDYVKLHDPNNFYVNFCTALGGPQKSAGRKVDNSFFCSFGRQQVTVAKAIGVGKIIMINGNPLAEIIDNNLFIYVDLLMDFLDHFYTYYSRGLALNPTEIYGDPMDSILPLIIEAANKIL